MIPAFDGGRVANDRFGGEFDEWRRPRVRRLSAGESPPPGPDWL